MPLPESPCFSLLTYENILRHIAIIVPSQSAFLFQFMFKGLAGGGEYYYEHFFPEAVLADIILILLSTLGIGVVVEKRSSCMKQVTIVCDGSSLGNGKGATRAAAVALLGFKGYWKAVGEYLGNATNQQAEIAAACIGLENLREPCKVTLLSDSRYVVETMTGNFRKKTNHIFWEKLEKAASKHQIDWQWVKGHDGHEIQEVVDKTARKIAELGRVDKDMLEEAAAKIGVREI